MNVEYPAMINMNYGFYIFSIIITLVTSFTGFLVNFYFVSKSLVLTKSNFNGFRKLCIVKTVNNSIICSTFLFWVMPVTLLGLTYSELSYSANRFLSGISAMWAYILNSLIQVCLACNRFYGLYFPFGIKIWKHVPMTNLAIMIAVTITSVLSLVTFPVGCGYVYDPSFFLWRPEDHECSKRISVIFPFVILTTTIITNIFNVAVGIRLLVRKIGGVREQEAKERRKRWMIMFTQSVIQDCLQLFDTVNSYYIVLLSEKVWFQFIFVTLSLVTISALDGLVMFACNSDIHPTWIKKLTSKTSKTIPVPVTLSGQSFHK